MNLPPRCSGILLHFTSLPGPHGIGDLGPSAYHFVDWLQGAGQTLWQVLPTTPIGPGNSPYQSVSAFAGSPLMVALEPLVEQGWLAAPAPPDFAARHVEFERVAPWRMAQLRAAHAGFLARADEGAHAALQAFGEREAHWLHDYTLFMALEAAHGGQPWWSWPAPLARRDPAALAAARQAHAAELSFWHFVQWCFDRQCTDLKRYANERGVRLFGDLPIFIAHHSADCWARPDLYLLDDAFQPTVVAGVPPDSMGPLGQRWGNPLYRWDRMAAEDFRWWTQRMRRALAHADLVRIDHFRGFAGYWEIPAARPDAIQGQWRPGPGKPLFDAMTRALGPLPIVAEDLGLITDDVHALRNACGFPGMKILQFGFGGDGSHEFLPHNHPVHCVAYTGTHDNDTVQGWWQSATEAEQRFAAAYLRCGDAATAASAMVHAAALSVARWAVFPLQDVLGLDSTHRMNTPGTQGPPNWCWRFDWAMVGPEPGRRLAALAAVSGRGPMHPWAAGLR